MGLLGRVLMRPVRLGMACRGLGTMVWAESRFLPGQWVARGLEMVHESTGLPWWALLGISACSVRLLTLPFKLTLDQTVFSRMHNFGIHVAKLKHMLKLAKQNNDQREEWRLEHELMELMTRDRTASTMNQEYNVLAFYKYKLGWRSLHGLVSAFVLATNLECFRLLSKSKVAGMTTEGLSWFPDLTDWMPCMELILPVTLCSFALRFFGMPWGCRYADKLWFIVYWGFPPVIQLFAMTWCPIGLAWLWICSNTTFLILDMVLLRPGVRKIIGLPELFKNAGDPMEEQEKRRKKKEAIDRKLEEATIGDFSSSGSPYRKIHKFTKDEVQK